MGLKAFLGKLFGSSPETSEPEMVQLKGRNMSEENTLIFTTQPDCNCTVGFGDDAPRISSSVIEAMQKETAKISAENAIVPGHNTPVKVPLGRGVGNTPMQPPPQYNQNQQQAPAYMPQQFQQQQYYQPQQQYQQPMQQPPMQQPQYQQPMYQQEPQCGYYIEEPYSELVLTNTECHVIVDLPGVHKEDIDISLTNNNDLKVSFSRVSFVSTLKGRVKGTKGKRPKIESQINIPDFILGKHEVSYHIPRAIDTTNAPECTFSLGQAHIILKLRSTESEGIKINIK